MRRILAAALVCLAVLAGSPAHAARQLRADDDPALTGPLTETGKQCDEQTLKSDGNPVIDVDFCVFFFAFDTLSELDLDDEYGVVWAQATFDARPGFCTSQLSFYVEVSPGTRIYDRTPPKPVKAKRPVAMGVEVSARAGESYVEEGLVSQRFRLLPGKMTPTGKGDEPRVGVAWSGRSPEKLGFATGAEVSWPMLAPPPQVRLGADTIRLTSGPGC